MKVTIDCSIIEEAVDELKDLEMNKEFMKELKKCECGDIIYTPNGYIEVTE